MKMGRTGSAILLLCLITMEVAVFESHCQVDFKKMAAGVRRKCLAETGTTAEIVDESEVGEFPDDRKLACYFKCILERFNMFTKSGKLNFNLMRKIVPEHFKDIGYDMIDSCTHITGQDRCDFAYDFMKCLYTANPVAFIVV